MKYSDIYLYCAFNTFCLSLWAFKTKTAKLCKIFGFVEFNSSNNFITFGLFIKIFLNVRNS